MIFHLLIILPLNLISQSFCPQYFFIRLAISLGLRRVFLVTDPDHNEIHDTIVPVKEKVQRVLTSPAVKAEEIYTHSCTECRRKKDTKRTLSAVSEGANSPSSGNAYRPGSGCHCTSEQRIEVWHGVCPYAQISALAL